MPRLVKQHSENETRHQHRRPFYTKLMRSSRLRIPGLTERELPLRIRWWLSGATALWLGLMAMLGFTRFTNSLPLNDKLLHAVCFAVLASLFFLTIDIDDSARRIWYWRHLPSVVTIFSCTFCASIVSEFVQSLLPYKEFQTGDVVANILGSLVGYAISLALDRAHRRRRAISALYAPLSEEPDIDEAQEDEYQEELRQAAFRAPTSTNKHQKRGSIETIDSLRMANVWDEREELFGMTDSEEDLRQPRHGSSRR